MSKTVNVESKVKDIQQGIALSITFFIIGGLLYFNPYYTGSIVFSYLLTILSLLIGIIGLGIELNKLGDQTVKLGFDDLGIGLGLVIAWATIYYFFPIWWVNLITLILLFFGIYGTTIGAIKVLRNLFLSKKSFLLKLPIVIVQFTAFIAAIFTILNILKII
ncbi:hypothetical protein [Metasolibacillus sp. FSL K6-0083]|uniref:hypothetical protein n=1 Tax=Metasolibacillus sp. FSL K6-0083 TaxID=2921416 RepID=UPI00079C15BE|nr:hypothetical protein A0U40_04240 [[Bacillus] sp. KCTC 13219]